MNGRRESGPPIRHQEAERMSGRTIIGIALLIVGVLALAYQGFSYTVPKKAVDLGPIQVTRQERHTVPLPPVLGALALIGGIAVLVLNRSSK
jgi:uncharacterized membrane protein HdeD (DUF308 family)